MVAGFRCPASAHALLGLAFLFSLPVHAQTGLKLGTEEGATPQSVEIDPELASPRDTLITFEKAVQAAQDSDDEQQWERVYKTLSIPESAESSRRDAALLLHRVIAGLGEITPETLAPDAEEAQEERIERFEIFPENPREQAKPRLSGLLKSTKEPPPGVVALARDPEAGWKFNAETIDSLAPLVGWFEGIGIDAGTDGEALPFSAQLRNAMPEWAKGNYFLRIETWQWAALALVLFLSVLTYLVSGLALVSLGRLAALRLGKRPKRSALTVVARPMALVLGALVFLFLLKQLGIVGVPLAVFLLAGRLVLVAGGTWMAWSFTDFLTGIWHRHADRTETTFDDMLVPLVRKTLKLIIVVWAIIYIAASIDILNFVAPLLAGFGLAGLAVSFAAQDLIRNLFGGITIFLDRPFQVGERIILEGYDGVVEEIGFRSSRLRTKDGHQVTVPNGVITNHSVENVGRRPSIRRDFQIGITYDTPVDKIRETVETIRGILESEELREPIHPMINGTEFPPRVFFEEFGDSALLIRVIYWYADSDYWAFTEHAGTVNLLLLEKLSALGVEFAFPTQTLHVAGTGNSDSASDTEPRS